MANLYLISNLKTSIDATHDEVKRHVAERLNVPESEIGALNVVKRSLDARKKPHLFSIYQVEVTLRSPLREMAAHVQKLDRSRLEIARPVFLKQGYAVEEPIVIVGIGPAGLFAALALAEAGLPVLVLERGKPVETRMRDIGQLRSHGDLDPESNVCFGEGGAGAYTDGKLYTRVKHPHVRWVMKRFVDFGAPEDILIDAHPHLGTDKLVKIVKRMRAHLVERGVVFRFETKAARIDIADGAVRGVSLMNGAFLSARKIILAIGHSARDTLAQLHADGVFMEPKPFAVGVRVEHPQALINRNQYGDDSAARILGAAAYQLTHQVPDPELGQRGVYTFCMCPGGLIVPSPTEPLHMAVNGMSNANRSTAFANSGVVVQVTPEDLVRRGFGDSPLRGIAFQRFLERRTYQSTRKSYAAPGMKIGDFIAGKASGDLAPTHFRPAAEPADLREVLPDWIAEPLRLGLIAFDRKIKGYAGGDANMLAVESRTSAPIRIPRGRDMAACNVAGLYPIGEGAGYAGGIVSAAVDGVKVAEIIVSGLT